MRGILRGRETKTARHGLFPKSAFGGSDWNRHRPGKSSLECTGPREMVGKVLNASAIDGSNVGNSKGAEENSDLVEDAELFASISCPDKNRHKELIVMAEPRGIREIFRDAKR